MEGGGDATSEAKGSSFCAGREGAGGMTGIFGPAETFAPEAASGGEVSALPGDAFERNASPPAGEEGGGGLAGESDMTGWRR